MVFSSLTFIYVFLPVVMAIYYATPKKYKNLVLLLEGMLFYAWGEPVYIIVVMASTLMDYFYGRLMHRHRENPHVMKSLLIISVVSNVGILAVFKYSSFLIANLNLIFHLNIPDPHIPLPVGVSFHTFQSMSYTIDMYMGNIAVQNNVINFCTYVTLFPQMVAGPIVRYSEVEHEIDKRVVNLETLSAGVKLFVIGLAKKVLLANNIGVVWDTIRALPAQRLTVTGAWFGILCFTFQIFFDFSGYSDMAVGLGKMLGFDFPKNFNYPYLAKSISDFWRRWHITL
ncbi:MAG: MBOAT family O-acyltransferase, partial [Clostridia bacterium]|nr:MBOAT family O-acyltransferase [Clostridia bacterium]